MFESGKFSGIRACKFGFFGFKCLPGFNILSFLLLKARNCRPDLCQGFLFLLDLYIKSRIFENLLELREKGRVKICRGFKADVKLPLYLWL
ncbi:hypothetical protein [Methanosarcina horonobensis]|uniref:hypothetical protein n=1 Tax=Methanosarcina horonobensis TaxID=418008 RepID=UPI0022B8BC83|nr:hypothetical protein [Methanosarcina horonobensis]